MDTIDSEMVVSEEKNGLPIRRQGKNWITYLTCIVRERLLEFYSATYYAIGGDTSLDVGAVINLGKINIIPCMCSLCFLSMHSLYI